jgi:hypothetical protein
MNWCKKNKSELDLRYEITGGGNIMMEILRLTLQIYADCECW